MSLVTLKKIYYYNQASIKRWPLNGNKMSRNEGKIQR